MDRRKISLYQYVFNKIDENVLRILYSVDKQITKNFREAGIATRPSTTNGLWCCILLPSVLILYSLLYNVSLLYNILAAISVGLVFYCFLFIVFVSVSCLVLKESICGGCVAAGLISALIMYSYLQLGLIWSLIYSMGSVYAFSYLLRYCLTKFPKTFTIGEGMIVSQSIILFAVMAFNKTLFNIGDVEDDEMQFINSVNFTILSSVGIIVTALMFLDDSQRNLHSLAYIVSVAGTYALMILHVNVGVDCILRLAGYIMLDNSRAKLFLFWLSLALIAAAVIMIRTRLAVKASTVTRKTFHVLASVVFLSGILYNIRLMTLAAGFGLGLIIIVEALRKSGIEPLSSSLESAFLVYSDEKDVGYFAMTPIYLYAGLACPLILVPIHQGYELELLSGVLSIGVGDTAASWFGSKYGFNKWADGHKTFEGTAFNILTQIATVHALEMFGLLNVNYVLIRTAVAASISGLVEAKTDQVDNLILPFVTMIAFQITAVLC